MVSCLKYNFEITCAWKKEFAFLCYHQHVNFRLIFGMDLLNCLNCYHSSSLCVHCVLVKFVQSDMSGNPDSSTLKTTLNSSRDSFKKKTASFHSTSAFQTTALHLRFQFLSLPQSYSVRRMSQGRSAQCFPPLYLTCMCTHMSTWILCTYYTHVLQCQQLATHTSR